MSNYTKTTNFTSKDSLPSGNSDKIVKGSEIDTEFNNIQTAVETKLNTNDGALTGTTTFQTLSDGTIAVTAFVDEDNMASNSATLLPTQQSVKAYVDSQVTAQDLDFQADTGGALSIDLDSETLTLTGGTGVDTSGSGNAVTFAIDSTVATLTGSQTLSNKTLSTPVISGNLTTNGLIDGRDVATDGTKLDGIESGATGNQTAAEIKTAYESNADTNAFTDADHSKLDGIEASADVTDTANVTAAGALMDSELTAIASVKALNQGVATTDSPTFAGLTLGATALTATAAELNVLDGITSTTAELNILDGVTSTAAELNILDGVTSTAAELNILDGVTATATELNYVDGVTSAIQTQLDAKAALAGANFTGNVDVAGTLTTDAFSIEDATSPTLTLNDTTSANQKTTLSHTAGASVLTTGDNGVFGSFKVAAFDGTSTINRLLIADNGDVSLYEDGGATAKLVWDSSAEALEFADNAKAIFGGGNDLQIYHDGSDSYIKDAGTGVLYVQGSSQVNIGGANGTIGVQFVEGANITLRHNNVPVLSTTSTGIDVTGTVTAESLGIGTSPSTKGHFYSTTSMDQLSVDGAGAIETGINFKSGGTTYGQIYFNNVSPYDMSVLQQYSTGSLIFGTNDTERMRIDSSGNVGIGTDSVNRALEIAGNNNAGAKANYIRITDTDTSATANNQQGGIEFFTNDPTAGICASIEVLYAGNGGGGEITFNTNSNSGGTLTEAMRITSDGYVRVNTTAQSNVGTRLAVWAESGSVSMETRCKTNVSYFPLANYSSSGVYIGGINASTTATSVATSSDRRLKSGIKDADDAGSKVDAIQVRQFDWIANDAHQDYGMVAQELQEVIPNVIHESPDADKMLSVDYAGLVPMLVKEIQSLRSRVQQLENN